LLAKEKGFKRIFVPSVNAKEGAVVESLAVMPIENVIDLFHHLSGNKKLSPHPKIEIDLTNTEAYEFDMKEIRGQETAKRALELAAAGGHNVLRLGLK
jgi:magnesium chelatase family protein